uniref:Magnesium transport protein CorA n=1 Tax=Anthurium amnicola TaxID=1678845 RepID=A0A1D1Z0A8_9ARAE
MSSLCKGRENPSSSASSTETHQHFPVAAPPPLPSSPQQAHFMVKYLMKPCGFPQNDAFKVPRLYDVKPHESPGAGVCFLGHRASKNYHGRQVDQADRSVLCASEVSLEHKRRVSKDAVSSGSDIMQLLSPKLPSSHPSNERLRVEFLGALFGSKDRLLRASIKNRHLMLSSIDEKIKPNVSLLRDCLTSEHRVMRFVSRRPRLITSNVDKMREVIQRVESLGISKGSGMFEKALCAISDISRATFDSKFMLLKSFGWAEAEFLTAFRKNPTFLGSSEMKIRSIMEFLLKEVGCQSSYVANHPILLTYSLEGRLKPRQYVLRMLKLNDVIGGKDDFLNAVSMTEKAFLKRYVLRNTEKVPELLEGYVATCPRGESNLGC